MVKRLLWNPLLWAAVVAGALLGLVTALSYLGGFVNPAGNMRDMPLAVANEDRGATVNGATVNLGADLVALLTGPSAPLGRSFKWTVMENRGAVLSGLADDRYYGALVIPEGYTARLLAMRSPAGPAAAGAAQLEVLTSPASGSIAGVESQAALVGVVERTSNTLRDQLLAAAKTANANLSPDAAAVVADPVQEKVTVAQPVGSKSGRGLAPFYFAVVLTVSGFLAVNLLDRAVLFLSGREEIDVFQRAYRAERVPLTRQQQWLLRSLLGVPMALLTGALIAFAAIGLLGMDAPDAWRLAAFALLAVLVSVQVTIFFLTLLGTPGLVAAVLFITILAVPSAGGVYPPEMMPATFRFLHVILPLTYVTDGARALMFFDGRGSAGLATATGVLSLYAVGSALAGWGVAVLLDRLPGDEEAAPLPAPAAGA